MWVVFGPSPWRRAFCLPAMLLKNSLQMENNNQSSVKTKNITLGGIIAWVIGLVSAFTGITSIFTRPLSGILFLLIAAVTLPPAYNFLKSKLHVNLSKGLRIVLVFILLIISVSTLPESKTATEKSSGSSDTAPVVTEPAIQVTATKLIADYKANEVSADAKYKNKIVEVSGVVKTIGKDILDTPYIALTNGEQYSFESVQCMFSEKDESQLANVSKDDRITLRGEVSGKLGNVLVKGCKIVK